MIIMHAWYFKLFCLSLWRLLDGIERVLILSENFIKNDEYHNMFSSKNQPKDEQGSIKYPHSDVTEDQHKRHVKAQCKPFQWNCSS